MGALVWLGRSGNNEPALPGRDTCDRGTPGNSPALSSALKMEILILARC